MQVTCGNVGLPKFGPAAFGVSSTMSDPLQSGVSPQMWRKLSQWPISWVTVRPRLKGAAAVPVVPKAVLRMTTPSVLAGPPGNCAYPNSPPASVQTQMLRYFELGQALAPPIALDFTASSSENPVSAVLVRVMPLVFLPSGPFLASLN